MQTKFCRKCNSDVHVLNEVVDGTFDECFVSLNYLKKKYDSKK